MTYRLAESLVLLRDQVNQRWPDRDKSSDGWIGDPAHISRDRSSDHNPWVIDSNGVGVVRALDIDAGEGANHEIGLWIAEHVRQLGAAGFAALRNGGYVISAARIASPTSRWAWRAYTGPNGHYGHTHISVSTIQAQYDSTASWKVAVTATTERVLRLTSPPMQGDDVKAVQRVLAAWYRLPDTFIDGFYGAETVKYVKRVQISTPPEPVLEDDGICGPLTRAKLGL